MKNPAIYRIRINISTFEPVGDKGDLELKQHISEGIFISNKKRIKKQEIEERCIQRLKPIWQEAFPNRAIDCTMVRCSKRNDFFIINESFDSKAFDKLVSKND